MRRTRSSLVALLSVGGALFLASGCNNGSGPPASADRNTPQEDTVAPGQDRNVTPPDDIPAMDLVTPPADLPPPPPPVDGGDASVPDGGLQPLELNMQFGPLTIPPQSEIIQCVDVKVGNDVDVWVRRISSALAPGSHHLILYRHPAGSTQENLTPYNCNSFEGILEGIVPLYIAQTQQGELNFPTDVALKFGAGRLVRLEMHYINGTAEPITGQGLVKFDALPAAAAYTEADLMFYGPFGFTVPAHATNFDIGPYYGDVRTGTKIFGLTTHTHKLGVNFVVEKSAGGGPGTELHRNPDNWDNPPLVTFDPVLDFAPGEGLRWTCTYTNPFDFDIEFGESANNEMCFLWAYYYPSRGFLACVPGQFCNGG